MDFFLWLGAELRSWRQPMSSFATTPQEKVVGLGGLEPPASPLSGVRSNHLSYRPLLARYLTRSPQPACPTLRPRTHVRFLDPALRSLCASVKSLRNQCVVIAAPLSGLLESCRSLVRTPGNSCCHVSKGGDPAAPSDTATLLRLHPSHRPHRGKRPPEG